MTKIKYTAMTKFVMILSALLVVIGLAVGLVCQFTGGTFFNKGSDVSSYQSVVVEYSTIEFDEEDITAICQEQFKANGISFSNPVTDEDKHLIYTFAETVDSAKLQNAVTAIDKAIGEKSESGLRTVAYHNTDTLVGGTNALVYAAIAAAVAVALTFVYLAIRYGINLSLSSLFTTLHNLVVFLAVIAFTRIPVGSMVIALALCNVVATTLFTALFSNRMKKNAKVDTIKAMPSLEQVDATANQSGVIVMAVTAAVAVAMLLVGGLVAIVTMSTSVLFPALAAAISVVVAGYGSATFNVCVYSRFKLNADNKAAEQASYATPKQD